MHGQPIQRNLTKRRWPHLTGLILLVISLPLLAASHSQAALATGQVAPSMARFPLSAEQSPTVSDELANMQALALARSPIYRNALLRFHGGDLSGKDGAFQKLNFDLIYLASEFQSYQARQGTASFQSNLPLLPIVQTASGPLITLDAVALNDPGELLVALQALGLQQGAQFGPVVSGQFPVTALAQLATLPALRYAEPASTTANGGQVTSQADRALRTDQARATYGIDGEGILIGVLSDSYDCLKGANADMAAGDLPPGTLVLAEGEDCATARDEGRAMMQLMSDIAPGARFAFHTAFGGRATFANGILRLANEAGAQVIVDDIHYHNEAMFQDGLIAQAVDQVAAAGVAYFSAAGNVGRQSYEAPYRKAVHLPLISAGLLHDFDPGPAVDPYQRVTIPIGQSAIFTLQWDQPYASTAGGLGASNDLDLMLVGTAGLPVAVSMNNNIGRDPVEVLRYTNPGPNTTFDLTISHLRGPLPQLLKYVYYGTGVKVTEYGTDSSTIYGHTSARGAIAVGAAFYGDTPAFGKTPPKVESFSSAGPSRILFDLADKPVTEIRLKPEIVAPDGVNTSFFGGDIVDPGDGSDRDLLPNFFGTSAAAPHAAAVAALMLQAQPGLSPGEIATRMQLTALRMEPIGADAQTGYGLLQGEQTVAQLFQHDMISRAYGQPTLALPGQPITYTLSLLQTGPNPARRLVITNTLPIPLQQIRSSAAAFGVNASVTTLERSSTYVWEIQNIALERTGGLLTITGIVDPALSVDSGLTSRVQVSSAGDTNLANNVSQATIAVVVPRVSFGQPAYTVAADGSYHFTLALDRVNPYADTTVTYTANNPLTAAEQTPFLSGTALIGRGQLTTTLSIPTLAAALLQGQVGLSLSQPRSAQLGIPAMLTLGEPRQSEPDPVETTEPAAGADRVYLPLIQQP